MSKFEKAAWLGVLQLGGCAILARPHPAYLLLLSLAVVCAGFALYSMYCRRRDERRSQQGFYVLCVTPRDSGQGFLWSGPHPTKEDAHEEIADSRRLVGGKDVLYVVDKDSYPPPSMRPVASATPRVEPSNDDG